MFAGLGEGLRAPSSSNIPQFEHFGTCFSRNNQDCFYFSTVISRKISIRGLLFLLTHEFLAQMTSHSSRTYIFISYSIRIARYFNSNSW